MNRLWTADEAPMKEGQPSQQQANSSASAAPHIVWSQAQVVLAAAASLPLVATLLGLSQPATVNGGVVAGLALLLGSAAVVLPSWAFARLAAQEHQPHRLLLLAWLKVVATLLLLGLAAVVVHRIGWPPVWALVGVVVAYIGHTWAALRS